MNIKKDNVIKLKIKENPKRKGTPAFKRFSVLMKMNGKRVRDFLAQEGRYGDLDKIRYWPKVELSRAIKLNLVELK